MRGICRARCVRARRDGPHPTRVAISWRASLLAALVVVCAATVGRAQDRRGWSDQDILIQLERDWDAAFLKNDVGFIANVLAEEFVATYDDGSRGDRARELKLAAEFNQQVDSSTLDDFSIRIYGETAVVAFTRQLVGPRQGVRTEVSYRYLDVFVWRDGRWQCVASQSTRMPGR